MARGLFSRLAPAALVLVCQLASAAPARAAGRVLTQLGSSLSLSEARVAEALGPDRTTVWVSVRVSAGPGRFALVLPVPPGTSADPALDAWLEALDAATAPRIRPPLGAAACGPTDSSSFQSTVSKHVASLPPSKVAVLGSVSELEAYAAGLGLGVGPDDDKLFAGATGARFLALVFDATSAEATTETVRLSLPVASAPLELEWLDSGAVPDVTLWAIGEGRAHVAKAPELDPDQVSATWKMVEGKSDYLERRRDLLVQKNGAEWLVESTGYTPLFAFNPLPNGAGAIEPAVKSYLELAKSEGASVTGVDSCLAPVWDAISAAALGAKLGHACSPGLLAQVPGDATTPACSETAGPGEVSAATLRCGNADDLAYALSGLLANGARLTRIRGVVGAATVGSTALGLGPGDSASPVVTAADADTSGCISGNGSTGGGSGSGGSSGWYDGSGGYGGAGASDTGPVGDPQPTPAPQTQVDVSCSGNSSSSNDSCSGNSSSSSDGDSCSKSSSSSSSSDGDTCGSSSSGSDGDSCGSSSSGSDGDTCSSSSGSSGDSCSSGSGGGSDCSLTRGPRPRVRVSALSLFLFGLLLPLRRASRRREKRRVSAP